MSVFHNNALIGAGGGAAAGADVGLAVRSLRFASAYLHRTPSSAGNLRTHTFAAWVKRSSLGGRQTLFRTNTSEMHYSFAESAQGNENAFFCYGGGGAVYLVSEPVFRDPGAFFHLCVAWDTTQSTSTDRLKLYINGVQQTNWKTGTFPGQNFEGGLNKANKHGLGANSSGGEPFSGNLADVYFIDGSALSPVDNFIELDSNGVYQAKTYSGTFGTNGFHLPFSDATSTTTIAADNSGNTNDFTAVSINVGATNYSGSVTDTASPSGSSMIIKAVGDTVTGTFNAGGGTGGNINYYKSTNGYNWTRLETSTGESSSFTAKYLSMGGGSNNSRQFTATSGSFEYSIAGSTSLDSSASTVAVGQGQLFDNRNLDTLFDSPKNGDQSDTGAGGEVSGNYCVLNPLAISGTLSNGGLEGQCPVGSSQHATFAIPASGKYYFEAQMTNSGILNFGLAAIRPAGHIYQNPNSVLYSTSGVKNVNAVTDQSYGASWTSGDIIGCACDADAGTITFYKNGASQGALSHQIADLFPSFGNGGVATNYAVNFGQRAFAFPAPSNHKPLCSTLLPTPTIANSSAYFNAVLYTGNNTARSITGVGHSPDWVWIKDRSSSYHIHTDILRGVGKQLYSNTTDTEASNTDRLTSFDSDGFSIAANTASGGVNTNNAPYVAWCWDAGSSTVSNTDGDITTSLRANTTAGFSIATYSGSGTNGHRIGHGLGVEPDFCIIKARNKSDDWRIYHSGLGTGKTPALNSSNAASTGANWQSISSTTLGLQNDSAINGSGYNYVAFFFAAVAGYSAVGGPYTGTGDTSGPFQYCGFRPRWIMIKSSVNGATNNGNDWTIFDTARAPYNETDAFLEANTTSAEQTGGNDQIDILSNGFKPRQGNTQTNHQSNQYFWIAFAENPFQANGGLAR